MKIVPYLVFNGHCREAFSFYETLFNGKIIFMQNHGESPVADEVPAEWHEKIMHAYMTIGDQEIMASDSPPDQYKAPQGTYISLQIDEVEEAERVYHALAEQGSIHMSLEKTFWAKRFAMLADRFGVLWMINCSEDE